MKRKTAAAKLTWIVAVAVFRFTDAPAETKYTLKLDTSLTWVDNVDLVPPSADEQSDEILQVIPGFTFDYKGARARAALDYTFTGVLYAQDGDRNQAYNTGSLSLGGDIIEQWFFVDAAGSYTQATIQPERPINTSLLFQTANVADVASYNISPYIEHDFGSARVEARYSFGRVDYLDQDPLGTVTLDDSKNQDALFVVESSKDSPNRLSWGLRYDSQHTDYDIAADYRYDKATAMLGWRLARNFKVFGSGGKETDVTVNFDDGGLDEPWWEAGVEWDPDQSNHLLLAGGHRFFGRTIRGNWTRTARLLKLDIAYIEEPTTLGQQAAFGPQSLKPGTTPEPINPEDQGRITSQVYIRRDFDARVTLTGQRTEISLFALDHRREYLDGSSEDRQRGGGVYVRRQLSGRSALYGSLSAQEADSINGGGTIDDKHASLGFERHIGRSTAISLEIARVERDSSSEPYNADWATLRFSAEF